jgi:hypothetical protein
MKKAPLAQLKEEFKDKAGLVAAVKKLAKDELFSDRLNEDKGLDHVSNRKLLHLHQVLTDVSAKFGGRSALIDAVLTLERRGKDEGFRSRLERFPTTRLWDMYRSAERRRSVSAAAAAAKAEGAPKKTRAKPAEPAAEKASGKKPAARKSAKG